MVLIEFCWDACVLFPVAEIEPRDCGSVDSKAVSS